MHWVTTVALMCVINGGALVMKDLGLVVSLGGAILGSALVYIFPALMAIGEKKNAISTKTEKRANIGAPLACRAGYILAPGRSPWQCFYLRHFTRLCTGALSMLKMWREVPAFLRVSP